MCDPGSVHSEPEFGSFESYYLTWYDRSYDDGEHLPFNQDRLSRDYSFWANEEEEDDHFSRNASYGHELLLPYNDGMNNWLAEFESYFVGSWGDDVVPSHVNCPEKSDNMFAGEVIQHGSHYTDDSQGSWQLDAGYRDEDYNYHERQVSEAARADSWDEMRLVESIFSHWPKLDVEDRTEPAVA